MLIVENISKNRHRKNKSYKNKLLHRTCSVAENTKKKSLISNTEQGLSSISQTGVSPPSSTFILRFEEAIVQFKLRVRQNKKGKITEYFL